MNADAKPKVLLVDDHPGVLQAVSRLLAFDFEVAVATDGQQALKKALHVDPDIVVLDITMPGMNGFQTAEELRRLRSRARVVFLTTHDADKYVIKAFRSGGHGYVVKTRVSFDLAIALNQVLEGRLFVPSLRSLLAVADGNGGHAALFYTNNGTFLDGLSDFLGKALLHGDAVAIVATDPVRAGLTKRLHARGWDVGGSARDYLMTDAADALSRFVRDGDLDAERMAEMVAEFERTRIATARGPKPRLTVFGELAPQLILNGNTNAALKVERLWNDLTHKLPFLTLCGYPMACFHDQPQPDLFALACAEHWAVSHAPNDV